jgi:hypothetical protein
MAGRRELGVDGASFEGDSTGDFRYVSENGRFCQWMSRVTGGGFAHSFTDSCRVVRTGTPSRRMWARARELFAGIGRVAGFQEICTNRRRTV